MATMTNRQSGVSPIGAVGRKSPPRNQGSPPRQSKDLSTTSSPNKRLNKQAFGSSVARGI